MSAVVLALGVSVWVLGSANRAASAAVASGCTTFAADAAKLFEQGESAALRGTFAPGDHVHLAIDFNGSGYAWETTGAIGQAPKVRGDRRLITYTDETTHIDIPGVVAAIFTKPTSTTFITSHGDISGAARLEVEVDVAKAGEGAITIRKTGGVPSMTPPRVAIASCSAARGPAT